ncbi:MAG: ABC transporter substrate-binding protein [Fervidobacterium sp.]|nr:ABC transporter substrate-binding protein [Fervidobacterium sp.]
MRVKVNIFLFVLFVLFFWNITFAQEIVVGVTQPLSGKFAEYGQYILRGISMAYEEVKSVLGKPIKLMILDNYSDKTQAEKIVERLVKEYKAIVIIGSYDSSLNIPSTDMANKMKIPYVIPTDTSPMATFNKPFVFRICFNNNTQAKAMAQYAIKSLGAKTAAILYDSGNDYSVGLAYAFREAFVKETKNDKSVVAVESYKSGERDFKNKLNIIASAKPDVLFAPTPTGYEGALIINQARSLGMKQNILGSDTWDAPLFYLELDSSAENVYFSSMFDTKAKLSDKTPSFVEKYKSRYGGEPSYLVAYGYDAYMVVVDSIKRANSLNPEEIRRALITTNYTGVTGNIRFDQNREALTDVIIKSIKKGKAEVVSIFKVQ